MPKKKPTKPDPDRSAGPELNALMVTEVMGWRMFTATNPEWPLELLSQGVQCVRFISPPVEVKQYDGMQFVKTWSPSTDIAAAWEVHQEIQTRLFSVRQRYYEALQCEVTLRLKSVNVICWPDVFGFIEPVDICRAALQAIETTTPSP